MDREKAKEVLGMYGRPVVDAGKTKLVFSRQNLKDVEELEEMDNQTLIGHWKSLVFVNYIYEQVSLSEMQRITLIELEFMERDIGKDLDKWFDETEANFDEDEFLTEN